MKQKERFRENFQNPPALAVGSFKCDFPSEYCKWYTSVFEVVKEYLEQIEKMKCCSNCKHNSKFTDNAEICWNCERQFSKIGEEIIKDEWELAE